MECLSAPDFCLCACGLVSAGTPERCRGIAEESAQLHRGRSHASRRDIGRGACKRCVLGSLHRSAQTADRKLSARQSGGGMWSHAGFHLADRRGCRAVPGRIGVAGGIRHQMQGGCAPDVSSVPVTQGRHEKCGARSGGGTIADVTLQRDVLQGASMAAMVGRGTAAGCKRVQVRDTRVTSGTGLSKTPWTEAWTMDACGTSVDVEIKFTPSAQGGTDWSIK